MLDERKFSLMLSQFRELEEYADIILVDTEAVSRPALQTS